MIGYNHLNTKCLTNEMNVSTKRAQSQIYLSFAEREKRLMK
jgi:hypothetical protein